MQTSLIRLIIIACGVFLTLQSAHSQDYTLHNNSIQHDSNNSQHNQSGYILGSLSARWESGNRGPSTISTSIHDPGGTSYGTYQISNKHGYVSDYLKHEGAQFCEYFEDFKPGTTEFNKRWKRIAMESPQAFHQAEHNFIKRTHYDPFVYHLRKQLQFDVRDFSPIIQDVIWSTAVQHGPNSQVVINALKSDPIYQLSEYEIINKIYTERSKKTDDNLYYFPRIKENWQNHLTNRFDEERMEALAQLRKLNNHYTVRRHPQQSPQNKPVVAKQNAAKQASAQVPVKTPDRSAIRKQIVSEVQDVTDNTVEPTKKVLTEKRVLRQVQHTTYDNSTIKEKRYRILLMTLDTADYPFDDLSQETVYTEWDEGIGFYNYYIGRHLNKEVASRLLVMLKSKGYSVGKIVTHK